jgi:membrane-bound metal-dependent hydrolase YbcI (DUF457 family)
MTGRTHDLAAISLLGVILVVVPAPPASLSTLIACFFANQIGGILPDIDQPTAPFWRNLPIGKYFGKIFGKLIGGHRFLTHSLLGLMIIGLISHLLLTSSSFLIPKINIDLVWHSFMIGIISHLIFDAFTKEGIPLLLPLPFSFGLPPIKKLRVKTGKNFEKLIIFPGLIIFDLWLAASHYYQILYYLQHLVS